MPEQTIDVKKPFPEGAIFIPPPKRKKPSLWQRFWRLAGLVKARVFSKSFDLSAAKKLRPINLKPARPYDWQKWFRPQVTSLRRAWFASWYSPRRWPLLALVGLRKCFIVFVIFAFSLYLFIGSGSVFAVSWQKQQELTPLASEIVNQLELSLEKIIQGETAEAQVLLAASQKQLNQLQADFGGINLPASLFNQSKLGLGLLALRLGDELTQGIDAIAKAVSRMKTLALASALGELDRSRPHLLESQRLLGLADFNGLYEGQLAHLNQLSEGLAQSINLLSGIKNLSPLLIKLTGSPDPAKILILLQNTGESRATGGFIGVFALASFKDGKLNNLSIHDSYDFDGRLFQEVKAPPFLRPYVNNIALRDSNHQPDFPTSARLAAWFLEQEKGPTVDAVIALNENILADILRLVGPINLPEYQLTVDSNNFYLTLEYVIETSKDHPNTPKQILIDLIDQIIKRLAENPQPLVLLEQVLRLASEKQILIYSPEPELSKVVEQLGVSGIFPPPLSKKQDFLAVIHTSLSGNKSDYFIDTNYTHSTFISRKGKLVNRLEIERRHHFAKTEEDFLRNNFSSFIKEQRKSGDVLLWTLGAGPNQDLVRVFVPYGSKLISAYGVALTDVSIREDEQAGLTVFEFRQSTNRGDTSKVALRYELPFYLPPDQYALYQLKFSQQPGQKSTSMNKEMIPTGQQLYFLNQQQELERVSPYRETMKLSQDHTFAVIVEQ